MSDSSVNGEFCLEKNTQVLKLGKQIRLGTLTDQKKVAILPRSASVRHIGLYITLYSFFDKPTLLFPVTSMYVCIYVHVYSFLAGAEVDG